MKNLFILPLFIFFGFTITEPNAYFPKELQKTAIAKLNEVDSLNYYQCYCVEVPAAKTLDTSAVAKKHKKKYRTVTEKFTLVRNKDVYRLKYFTCSNSDYPGKKYPYLKVTEHYYSFDLKKDTILPKADVMVLATYETKLREVTEFDYRVYKWNSPQMIVSGRKFSDQYMVYGGFILKNNLSVFNGN